MRDVSLVVRHIEIKLRVRIGECESCDDPLENGHFLHVIGDAGPVVRHKRNRNDQENHNHSGVTHEFSFHAPPSVPNEVLSCFSSAVPTCCYVGVVHRTSSHLARIVGTARFQNPIDSYFCACSRSLCAFNACSSSSS